MHWDEEDSSKDRLLRDYDTVLKECTLLTTFGGVLFGFLLNISIRGANQLIYPEKIVLVLALFSITIAVSFFVMPVIYHHLRTTSPGRPLNDTDTSTGHFRTRSWTASSTCSRAGSHPSIGARLPRRRT